MTALTSYVASAPSTQDALDALMGQAAGCPDPQLVFVFYGCGHDDALLHQRLRERFAQAGLIGGTSSGGVLSRQGFGGSESIGLLCLSDPDGDYGVAAGPLGEDAAEGAEALLHEALRVAGAPGELPELIWIYQAPGREEQVLRGLRRVVGDRCPVIGGSSADDDISGRWRQLGPQGPLTDGLVVAVLLPSTPVGFAFQGGYEPAGPSGIVTGIGPLPAAAGADDASGREIVSIDDEPAAAVYNRWTAGCIDAHLDGGTVLAETTMHPLATLAGQADGVSQFLLVHPLAVTDQGALRTFCDLQAGERVYAMRGDRQRLIERAGKVVAQARAALPDPSAPLAGVLLVYCSGCKTAVGPQIGEVAQAVARSLDAVPFLSCFTFGEQGYLIGRNVHGNLMISALVFAR
ncbi:FIST signal transduction protein [Pseudorhodoferax sp.]|uniref:FIST signal transduction protein n=1 Tax=Pseudorhodoferax sp. TaxID=1993553 RepID=UPI0039E279BE